MPPARQGDLEPCPLPLNCLPLDADSMPSARPVIQGASAVRWSEHALRRAEMHTRQWIGTYAGKGNGDYRGELASALQAITTYLKQFAFSSEMALARLDGQYGDAVVVAETHACPYACRDTRQRLSTDCEHPQLRRVLAHPATACVTRLTTGEVVELFDGGWLPLGEGLPRVRVIVARHPAPPPVKSVTVGKRIDEWVYELFLTDLDADGFLAEDILDLSHGRGADRGQCSPMKMLKKILIAGALTQSVGRNSGKWPGSRVWNLRLTLGKTMQGAELREMEWASPKEAPPFLVVEENPPEEYGPWQWATSFGRATGLICAEAFTDAARMGGCAAKLGPASG